MEIVFDPAKDLRNRAKHGVSLVLAARLEWDLLLAIEDTRRDYGEPRIIGFAPIKDRVYCVVFTDRPEHRQRRIISLRKAYRREVRRYARKIEAP